MKVSRFKIKVNVILMAQVLVSQWYWNHTILFYLKASSISRRRRHHRHHHLHRQPSIHSSYADRTTLIFYHRYHQLQILSEQLRHRSPVISCGLFDFNWALYYSVNIANSIWAARTLTNFCLYISFRFLGRVSRTLWFWFNLTRQTGQQQQQ